MKKNQSNKGTAPVKGNYLDRVTFLANRIQRDHLRCLKEVTKIMNALKSIEGDIEIIAQEVARQAKVGRH